MATGEVRRARQGTRTWLAALVIVSVLAFFLAPLFPKARPEAAPPFTEVDVREESASSAIDAFANNEETVQTSAFVGRTLADGRRKAHCFVCGAHGPKAATGCRLTRASVR